MSYQILSTLLMERDNKVKGRLYHNTQILLAYNSNRIEGTRLSEEQTRSIFETISFIADKEEIIFPDDIIETKNHFKAFDYLLDVADATLSEEIIKRFHFIIKNGTEVAEQEWFNVGEYKKLANTIGSITETTSPENVKKEIASLLIEYNKKEFIKENDIIDFHYKFEKIHPFQDGNGRVGRLIMFKECLKHKVVPFIIDVNHELFYKRGLAEYHNEKGYLIDTCLDTQDKYKALCDMLDVSYKLNKTSLAEKFEKKQEENPTAFSTEEKKENKSKHKNLIK